jgi:hypothetical protein
MKKQLLAFLLALTINLAYAQKPVLSTDENNKYIYYQVKEMPDTPADTLENRALKFISVNFKKISSLNNNNKAHLVIKSFFKVSEGTAVTKHESGEIAYTLTIESKADKYRYWFTDFVFTPYQRDRYNNYVPTPGITIPLEQAAAKLDKKDFNNCLDQSAEFCKSSGDKLVMAMSAVPVVKQEKKPEKIKTDKW